LGDGSCLNCSDEKKEFKRLKYERVGYPNEMRDFLEHLSVEKKYLLYNELNDSEDKPMFIGRLADIYKTEEGIPIEIDGPIKARIITVMKDEAEAQPLAKQPQAFSAAFKQQAPPAPAQPSAPTTGREYVKALDPSTGIIGMSRGPKEPGGGFKKFGVPTSPSGGKSRRRHRRGRTLHKRRKSSKVRKTRRTHTRR